MGSAYEPGLVIVGVVMVVTEEGVLVGTVKLVTVAEGVLVGTPVVPVVEGTGSLVGGGGEGMLVVGCELALVLFGGGGVPSVGTQIT